MYILTKQATRGALLPVSIHHQQRYKQTVAHFNNAAMVYYAK